MTPKAPSTNCLVRFSRSLFGLHTCSWRYRTTHWTYTQRADEYHCNCGEVFITEWVDLPKGYRSTETKEKNT